MNLRHPTETECEAVQALVQSVVDEVYGGLWTSPPVPIGDTDWMPAWIADKDGMIAGVALTGNDTIEDLWVFASMRGAGVGSALLSRCEKEIRTRGYSRARLRVISSNVRAIHFYKAQGWSAEREYPHETFPVMMTDMGKNLHA